MKLSIAKKRKEAILEIILILHHLNKSLKLMKLYTSLNGYFQKSAFRVLLNDNPDLNPY